jgi:hypothetical protein
MSPRALARVTGMLLICAALGAEPPDATSRAVGHKPAESGTPGKGTRRIAVEDARERAKLMHKIYTATLDTMHRHYFRRDRSVLPARAMEDVFARMAEESNIEARWIAVNTRAMSVDHEPKSPFDKQAAEKIASGSGEFERVEGGFYHRAGAIPLGSGCVGCHAGFGASADKSPRFAGLVISIPLDVE